LQSILISPQRKLAVIDGRTVPLGGEVNGAKLVAITEGGVTLRRGAQTETLRLNPGIEKKAVTR
jgi:MSHA biogenesis protein MshK